jgi:glutathione S-transferase
MGVKLVATPLSHFGRKIRILLAELGVPFEWVRPAGVLAASPAHYGDNPLMRVPTLIDGDITLIESDHIARYLVGKHDPADRFGVRSEAIEDLNALAVTNGIMANEVVVLLAKRAGLEGVERVVYFQKLLAAIEAGLAWLESRVGQGALLYRDIVLVSMWQHVEHYGLIANLERFPRIAARTAELMARPSIAATAPAAQNS